VRLSRQMAEKLAEALQIAPEQRTGFVRFARSQGGSSATVSLHQQLADLPPDPVVQPPAAVVDYTLVGRKSEYQALRSMWAKATQSGAQMVLIAGEAGIGKTRLAEELLLYVQRQGHVAVRARAYALEGRLAYMPLADWLRTPPLQARLAKLNPIWLTELVRLLPELLIQRPDLPTPEPLTERWQQKRLFEALRHAFTADAQPLLLLLDDLQWCDAETLAWLQYLVETAHAAPLLVAGTVRSDEVDEDHQLHQLRRALLHAGRLSTVDLAPLNIEETVALGAEVREYTLDSVAATGLFQATAGYPLFIVEMVRAGDNFVAPGANGGPHTVSPSVPKPGAGLPSKVYAVIEARLAQLSPTARTLAQVGATIGRAFTLPLLIEASREDEETVVDGLDELWQRRILHKQGGSRYDFTHDRIRDVAYAASSPARREHFHRRVAQALEKLHAVDLDPLAGELAAHYHLAGAPDMACSYYRRAATVANRLYAHSEEVGYLQKAIAMAQMLPSSQATITMEIDLWHELGLTQGKVHDWGNELVAIAWQKADELAAQAGNLRYRCRALDFLGDVFRYQGQWNKARASRELAVSLAKDVGDLPLIGRMSAEYGVILFHFGEFAQALATFKRHPAFAAAPAQPAQAWSNGSLPPGIFLRVAKSLWLLGFADQALACGQQVLALRRQHIDFVGHFATLEFASMFYTFVRDVPAVRVLSEQLTDICIQYDYVWFAMQGQMYRGWALAQQGDVQQGLLLVREAIDDQRRRTTRSFEPHYRSLLAESLALAGEWEEALDEVTETLSDAEEFGNRYWNSHLHKLQGDYMQALSLSAGEVEACYRRAIATARQQGAKSLELRATTSLCRLWQAQGKSGEAYALLSAIYSWFTEGFDTVDLREAKTLLDTLKN